MKRTIVIAVAGTGHRLDATSPKCMIKINGYYIFEYLLRAFEKFDEIRMVTGYNSDMVVEAVSAVRKDIVFINNEAYSQSSAPLQSFFLGSIGLIGKVLYSVGDTIYSRNSAATLFRECSGEDEFVTITPKTSENPIYASMHNDSSLVQLSRSVVSESEFAGAAYIDCSKVINKQSYFFEQLNHYMPLKTISIDRLEVDTRSDLAFAEKIVSQNPEQYDFWR